VLVAELGVDMTVFPHRQACRQLGWPLPRQPRERGQTPLRPHSSWQPLAPHRLDRSRPRRESPLHHRRLRGALSPGPAPGAQESDRGRGSRHPGDRVPSLGAPGHLPGPRRRRLRPPTCRAGPPPGHSNAGTPRLSGHPRTRGLSARRNPAGDFLSKPVLGPRGSRFTGRSFRGTHASLSAPDEP
jgi:hypothetical protein